MSKKKNLMDYVEVYIESCLKHEECTLNGNYKDGNNEYKKIDKIFKLAIKSDEKDIFYMQIFENTDNANALIWCCMNMLKLNINENDARLKLKEIAEDMRVHPLIQSSARWTLKEWDNGNIKSIV